MLEPIEDQYQKIGYISRSHGVDGEVLLIADLEAPQLFDKIDLVHIQNTSGDLVPARIESVRVQKKNNRLSFFVKFDHVSDRNRAEELKSFPVFVMQKNIEGLLEQYAATDYTSYDVKDSSGKRIGTVVSVIENPAHLILEISVQGQDLLMVPVVEEYVTSIDENEAVIHCRNLEQLSGL